MLVELVIQGRCLTSQHLGRMRLQQCNGKLCRYLQKNDDERRHTKPGTAYKAKPHPEYIGLFIEIPKFGSKKI